MKHNEKGPETALSATQSQDLVSRGVCTCPVRETGTERPWSWSIDCTCDWGALIKKLIRWGYTYPRNPQAIHGLLWVATVAETTILAQRDELLRRAAAQFDGPSVDFQTQYGISKTTFYRLGLRTKRNS